MPREVISVRAEGSERKLMERAAASADLALGTWLRTVGLRVARETLVAVALSRQTAADARKGR